MMRALTPGLALLLAACAAEPTPPPASPTPAPAPEAPPPATPAPSVARITPDAPFRQAPPPAGAEVAFAVPKIVELHLKNGARVLLVERHELPIVSLRVVATSGAGDLAWAPPGAVSMMGSMLEQGTTTRTALQVSDAFDALGAQHGTWVDWDWAAAAVKVTSDKLDAALAVLADVLLHPTFPADALERLRARRLAALADEKRSPVAIAGNATAAALYGRAAPYGHAVTGAPSDVQKLTREDVMRAYAALFRPKGCAIVVAGDVTPSALADKLEATLGAWAPPSEVASPPPARSPHDAKDARRLVVVDTPGAREAVVRLAEVAVADGAPDRDATLVMNAIFGGTVSSRLSMNLREGHGFAQVAWSRFEPRHEKGPFVSSATVKPEGAAASIGELFKEERRLEDEAVPAEELARAKAEVRRELAGRFETVEAVTQALTHLAVHRLPLDEYATLPARLEKVTADDVKKAARSHLHPRTTRVVVVGDRARLEATLEPLHLGPIEARDAYGDLLPETPRP